MKEMISIHPTQTNKANILLKVHFYNKFKARDVE